MESLRTSLLYSNYLLSITDKHLQKRVNNNRFCKNPIIFAETTCSVTVRSAIFLLTDGKKEKLSNNIRNIHSNYLYTFRFKYASCGNQIGNGIGHTFCVFKTGGIIYKIESSAGSKSVQIKEANDIFDSQYFNLPYVKIESIKRFRLVKKNHKQIIIDGFLTIDSKVADKTIYKKLTEVVNTLKEQS